MIHLDLDQLEFLPIFPYSELLIWMLHQLTDHSYFGSVYLKIFTALPFFGKLKTSVLYQCIVDLRIFFMLKNPQICNKWIYGELAPAWVRQTRTSALDCAYPGYGRPGV